MCVCTERRLTTKPMDDDGAVWWPRTLFSSLGVARRVHPCSVCERSFARVRLGCALLRVKANVNQTRALFRQRGRRRVLFWALRNPVLDTSFAPRGPKGLVHRVFDSHVNLAKAGAHILLVRWFLLSWLVVLSRERVCVRVCVCRSAFYPEMRRDHSVGLCALKVRALAACASLSLPPAERVTAHSPPLPAERTLFARPARSVVSAHRLLGEHAHRSSQLVRCLLSAMSYTCPRLSSSRRFSVPSPGCTPPLKPPVWCCLLGRPFLD
mmetsp:Transcript_15658/g.40029  ORF Transcript_15658/g.40029 Transcript_15658/m.40029 type:complete len:267 (+) Transcript_15658:927-1727(+)